MRNVYWISSGMSLCFLVGTVTPCTMYIYDDMMKPPLSFIKISDILNNYLHNCLIVC